MEDRILIVDDEEVICNVLDRRLTREGFFCTTANNGKEALNHFYKNSFSLIISDMKMPEMTGIELLQKVHAIDPKNMTPQELAEGHHHVQSEFCSLSSILRHIPFLLRVSPINLRRALLFLLLNIAGKSVAKCIDTSLDWADNNEKWNSQKIQTDDRAPVNLSI